MVSRQGSQRQEPCPSGQLLLNETVSKARMVASPIKQLPKAAPPTPTTWSQSQLHRQVHFQPASSSTQVHRPARHTVRHTSSPRWSQDRSLHGPGCRRPPIPIKKQSFNSAPWQTPFSTRPLPPKHRHRQATYTLRNPEKPPQHPETKRFHGQSGRRECFLPCVHSRIKSQILQQSLCYSSFPERRVHSATTRRILVLHQPTPASNTIRIDKTAPSPLLLSGYRVVPLLPAAGLDFKSEDLGRGHQCSQLCSKACWHSHAFVRRRPACLLWHRSRSLPSPRNHRQDARRCRDYKISDERPVDAFPSSSRSLGPPHRLQGSRQPATARKTLCHDSKSGTSSSLPGLAKPTPHLLKRFATIHRASRQRPLGHSTCSLSPPQHLQLPRAIPPALVFNTAGDRRPGLLAPHVHITPRQPANPLAPTSHYSFDNRRFRQYRLRQHPGSALRGPPRVRRLLDAMGTTTDHRP